MKKLLIAGFACAVSTLSTSAFSAPGEYWEISSKMEMPGMPFAMPGSTVKVCIPKGAEKDPRQAAPNKDCEMTDIKMSGNKSSWKMRCNMNGEVMNGTGEMSGNAEQSEGTVHLNGKSGGQPVDVTMSHKSKRLGGACDSDEMMNKIKGEMCDTSKFTSTTQWINSAAMFMKGSTCPGKKEQLCNAVSQDAPRDAGVYQHLVNTEKSNGGLIAKGCGLSMVTMTKSICKTLNGKNVGTLASYCPAEAKAYRDEARKKACEGRSYTAKSDLTKCLSGQGATATMEVQDAAVESPSKGADSGQKTGMPSLPGLPSMPNSAESVIDGAKKLKGLFGF